jgi:putative spermidine/putrescine transport system ATP-binding protein
MGFRNAVPGRIVSVQGDIATVQVGEARLSGILRAPLAEGAACVLAVRPDDLVHRPGAENTLPASAVSTEFRGNDFTGFARMADGTELVFASHQGVDAGTPVQLAAEPARTLVFAA